MEITVDKAISKGHLMVNGPVIIIMIGLPAISIYLNSTETIPSWGIGVGIVLGFIGAWATWSFMITKWRIWAFKNVRNVHELKRRAIEEKLIWGDGSVFEKTEIRTDLDDNEWKSIKKKFEKEDVYIEDITLPSETKIYYSKLTNSYEFILMLGLLAVGVYLIVLKENYIFGPILTILGAYLSFKEFKQLTDNNPQIIINSKGIETVSKGFTKWSEVENETVIRERSGKQMQQYFVFESNGEKEKIDIGDLKIGRKELLNILRTSRIRYKKTNANTA